MKKRWIAGLLAGVMMAAMLTGCASNTQAPDKPAAETKAETTESQKEASLITTEDILDCLEYDITQYVKLGDYMDLEVDLEDQMAVKDEDVEEMVKAFASMYPNVYEPSDKEVLETGDAAIIDYVGYLDGQEFDGGTAMGATLVIGSGSFIDGFEDQLIGMKAGQERSIDVTFPENYGVDKLNGQEVTFKVNLNAIETPVPVTYETISDKWVMDNFSAEGLTDLKSLRSYLHDYIKSLNESDQDTKIQNAIIDKIVENSEITIPDGYLEKRMELHKASVYAAVEESGQSFEAQMGLSEEAFLEELPANMERRVIKDMVLEALVADMGIEIKESDFHNYVMTYMNYYGFSEPDQLYAQFAKLSELDGEDYCLLGYAQHQAWIAIRKSAKIQGLGD